VGLRNLEFRIGISGSYTGQQAVNRANKDIEKMTVNIKTGKTRWTEFESKVKLAERALGKTAAAASKVWEMGKEGAGFTDRMAALDRMGVNVMGNLKEAAKVTKNTMSDKTILDAMTKMKGFQMDLSKMSETLALTSKAAVLVGRSQAEILDKFILGVSRGSPKLLDDLLIKGVQAGDVSAYAAEQFGIQASELTEAQKQAALHSLALEKLRKVTAGVSIANDSQAASLQRLEVVYENVMTTISQGVSRMLTNALEQYGWFSRQLSGNEGATASPAIGDTKAGTAARGAALRNTAQGIYNQRWDQLSWFDQKMEQARDRFSPVFGPSAFRETSERVARSMMRAQVLAAEGDRRALDVLQKKEAAAKGRLAVERQITREIAAQWEKAGASAVLGLGNLDPAVAMRLQATGILGMGGSNLPSWLGGTYKKPPRRRGRRRKGPEGTTLAGEHGLQSAERALAYAKALQGVVGLERERLQIEQEQSELAEIYLAQRKELVERYDKKEIDLNRLGLEVGKAKAESLAAEIDLNERLLDVTKRLAEAESERDAERFREAMNIAAEGFDMAAESESRALAAVGRMGQQMTQDLDLLTSGTDDAIAAIGRIGAAAIDDTVARAAVLSVFYIAQGIVSLVNGEYDKAGGYLTAGAMMAATAGMSGSTKAQAYGTASDRRRSQSLSAAGGGLGAGGTTVINVNAPVIGGGKQSIGAQLQDFVEEGRASGMGGAV